MIIKATQKNTRQTARKVRLVANAVRKLSVEDAIKQLAVIERKSSLVILKVLRQAIANAIHNHNYSIENLSIKNITVAPGPQYKRFRAVSRGRANTVVKKTCHITVELNAGESNKKAKTEKKTEEKVAKVEKKVEKKPTKKVDTKKTAKKKETKSKK